MAPGAHERQVLDISNKTHDETAKTTSTSKNGQESEFRDYENTEHFDRVFKTYKDMHTNQTVAYVKEQHDNWLKFDKFSANIMDMVDKLADFKDESDPDCDFANKFHAFQAAEGARKAHPDKDWLHLTGLIHDLGKVMGMPPYNQPQWSCVGDTFPVGCRPAKSIVYRENSFNEYVDLKDERYSSKNGVYEEGCGLRKVTMSWGHDEYLYQVLRNHEGCRLPDEALYCVRFHSFYPWHTGGDYDHLCDDYDRQMKPWILEFNKYDLYTKSPDLPDAEALKPYYQSLIDKYIPGKLKW